MNFPVPPLIDEHRSLRAHMLWMAAFFSASPLPLPRGFLADFVGLPEGPLVQIWLNLSARDVTAIMLSCRKWNTIAKKWIGKMAKFSFDQMRIGGRDEDPAATIHKIPVRCDFAAPSHGLYENVLSLEQLLCLLRRVGRIGDEGLDFSFLSQERVNPIVDFVCRFSKKITAEDLFLGNCDLRGISAEDWAKFVNVFKNLSCLHFYEVDVNDDSIGGRLKKFWLSPTGLSQCRLVTDDALLHMLDPMTEENTVHNRPSLSRLGIRKCLEKWRTLSDSRSLVLCVINCEQLSAGTVLVACANLMDGRNEGTPDHYVIVRRSNDRRG